MDTNILFLTFQVLINILVHWSNSSTMYWIHPSYYKGCFCQIFQMQIHCTYPSHHNLWLTQLFWHWRYKWSTKALNTTWFWQGFLVTWLLSIQFAHKVEEIALLQEFSSSHSWTFFKVTVSCTHSRKLVQHYIICNPDKVKTDKQGKKKRTTLMAQKTAYTHTCFIYADAT